MSRAYVSERGDLVWLSFSPQAGRKQAAPRSAVHAETSGRSLSITSTRVSRCTTAQRAQVISAKLTRAASEAALQARQRLRIGRQVLDLVSHSPRMVP